MNAGTYTLTAKATDNQGAATLSAPVHLTVTNPPPAISAIADQNVPQDTSTAPIPFTISDAAFPATSLVVTADSSNTTLLPIANILLGGTGSARTVTARPAPNQSGQARVTLTVRDGGGLNASTAFGLTVTPVNHPPIVPILSPSNGASFVAPAQVTISANATDSDGRIIKVEFFQGSIKLGEATSAPYSFLWGNVSAGAYTITVKATDDQGATTISAPVNVTVKNPPPTISAIADQSAVQDTPTAAIPFTVGDAVLPAASLVVLVDSSNQTLLPVANILLGGTGANRTVTLKPAASQSGQATVTLTVQDGGGLSASSTFVFRVTAVNRSPLVSIVSPSNGASFSAPANLTIAANATDSDGSVRKVEFFQGITKLGEAAAAPYNFFWNNVGAGTYILTAKATDNQGATTVSASVNVTVKNAAPTISPIADLTIDENTSSAPISFSVGDAETPAGALEVSATSWNTALVPLANLRLGGTGAARTLIITPAANQFSSDDSPYSGAPILLTVTDAAGATTATLFNVKVKRTPPANHPPVVSIASPSNGAAFSAPANVTIAASALDSDGSIGKVEFFQGAAKLGEAASAPYSFFWNNVAAGAYTLTARATDNLGATAVSAPISITVTNVPVTSTIGVRIASPANRSSFCPETDIPIVAVVSNATGAVTVEFSSGDTVIGSVRSSPYQFTWLSPPPGDYSLTAKATDSQGHSAKSSPVSITISEICGDVAIVRTALDPEIERLQDALFEMGLSSRVFDHNELSLISLRGYRLIIWHDASVGTSPLTANDVTFLQGAYLSGIPLYFIGERLAAAGKNLPEPQRSQWIRLTHLNPATGIGGDGAIHLQSTVDFNLIFHGRFAQVQDFAYPARLDLAQPSDTDADVLGTSAGSAVLLCFPALDFEDIDQVRTFTQNVRVLPDASTDEALQLRGLFQNVVCWILRCTHCGAVDVRLEIESPPDPVPAGEPLRYTLDVFHGGECEAIATVLTDFLPPEFQFIRAESEQGTWKYDSATHQVIFLLGHLQKGALTQVAIDVLPTRMGTFTNSARVRIDGPEVTLGNNAREVVTLVSGGTVITEPELTFASTPAGGYELRLSGQIGVSYALQYSTDLTHWVTFTNITGVAWHMPLPLPAANKRLSQFYRLK